jgi:hypothetical protein
MIPACIFTYSGDALPLRECVRGVIAAGLVPYVFDDAESPLPRHMLAWLESNGAQYHVTDFQRNGNLNGTECALGIVCSMILAMRFTGSEIALKLDTDTLILDGSPFLTESTGVCAKAENRHIPYGACYSLTRGAAMAVFHGLQGQNDPTAPEDLTIWGAVLRSNTAHTIHDFNPNGGAFSAVPEQFQPSDCLKFAVCTFGNQPRSIPHVTQAMQTVNNYLQTNPKPSKQKPCPI